MKSKDIFLDFTPLLDVTLILLFFFLLFSTFEMEEVQAKLDTQIEAVEEQLEAAEDRMKEADSRYAEANDLVAQLEEDLAIVENANNRQASNIEALMEFNRGANIKLILSIDNGNANLRVFQGDTLIATTSPENNLTEIICTSLEEAGYSNEDTVLCEFIFDGSQAGTTVAYRHIKQNLLYVKGTYKFFYYSETDLSIGDD